MITTNRQTIRPQAVNGCCDTGCENPYDLAIVPLSVKLDDGAAHSYKVLTNTFPGRIVGMRVLNTAGEVDVVSISQPQQAAGATYIGSGNVTAIGGAPASGTAVDAASWWTDECLCAVDLGCVTNTIGPTITIQRSAAAPSVQLTRPLVSSGADVFVRINFYVCYDDGTLKNPNALCGTGAVVR